MGLPLTSLWYSTRKACLHALRRLNALPLPRASDPCQVLVGARVNPHPVADVYEQRHLNHEPGLERRGLAPPGSRITLEPRIRLGHLQIYVRRGLDAHYLPVG